MYILSPKNVHKHCFQFLLDGFNTKEKWKTSATQNFGWQIRCIMGDVQVAKEIFPTVMSSN